MTESIELTGTCPTCGHACVVHAGEYWSEWRHELAWFRSFSCDRCGGRTEEDGGGFPEPDLRDALLRERGRWAIEVIGPSPVVVAKALRKLLGLSLRDALDRVRAPDGRCWDGTMVEAHWMQDRLRIEGAETRVRLV